MRLRKVVVDQSDSSSLHVVMEGDTSSVEQILVVDREGVWLA